jgi:DNA-binding FadR family transcriptional regulator
MIESLETGRTGAERAAEGVARALAARVLSGEIPQGAPLPAERELTQTYGVSRTVAREAVAMLAARGLAEARARHRPVARLPGADAALGAVGGVVSHLLHDERGVRSLYETRVFVEAALVRQVALMGRREVLAALRAALAENAVAVDDPERFYQTDMAFHAALYEAPRNPVFPAIHRAFTAWLAPRWRLMPRSPERNRVNFASHAAILDAVLERDADGAEAALRTHLATAWEYVRPSFAHPGAGAEAP